MLTRPYIHNLPRKNPSTARPGQAAVEMAIVAPILLLLVLATVDFARALNDLQVMADLTRQGSSMASRGTTLSTATNALVQGSAPLNLASSGEIIITAISRVNNTDQITGQVSQGVLTKASKIGIGVGSIATVPSAIDDIFKNNSNETVYATEVYYSFAPITPLASLWNIVIPNNFYQIAYF